MEFHQRNPSVSDFVNEKNQTRKMKNEMENSIEEGDFKAYFKDKYYDRQVLHEKNGTFTNNFSSFIDQKNVKANITQQNRIGKINENLSNDSNGFIQKFQPIQNKERSTKSFITLNNNKANQNELAKQSEQFNSTKHELYQIQSHRSFFDKSPKIKIDKTSLRQENQLDCNKECQQLKNREFFGNKQEYVRDKSLSKMMKHLNNHMRIIGLKSTQSNHVSPKQDPFHQIIYKKSQFQKNLVLQDRSKLVEQSLFHKALKSKHQSPNFDLYQRNLNK